MEGLLETCNRSEIIDGVVYNMSSATVQHIRIQRRLTGIIDRFLRGKRCEVFFELDVKLDDANKLSPDISIVCDPSKVKNTYVDGAPDFVAEILSPSTRKRDMTVKKDLYEKFGVKEYWIISPKDEAIEVYRLNEQGDYYLDNIYTNFSEDEWEQLNEAEKEKFNLTLKISLYDELEINIKDVFED